MAGLSLDADVMMRFDHAPQGFFAGSLTTVRIVNDGLRQTYNDGIGLSDSQRVRPQ